jgi:MFS family permease
MMLYRNYALAVLCIATSVVSNEDVALMLVAQDLKRDLVLTDTQIGLLQGFAFILFYAITGLSVARQVDRGNRVVILSLALVVWGAFLAASGTATSFLQLVLCRVGVAIGEAACGPVTVSLISDYFDRTERPRANSIIFALAPIITQLVGNALAGRVNEVYGWRSMFMFLSLPGFAIAILAWFTLREPRLESFDNGAAAAQLARAERLPLKVSAITSTPAPPRMKDVILTLWCNTTLRHLYLWNVVGLFTLGSISRWQVAFFVRSYGLKTGELGGWFAFLGILGAVGSIVGGTWCSRYAANNERLQLGALAIAVCGLAIVCPCIYLVHNYRLAFGLMGLSSVLWLAFIGGEVAVWQTLVPKNMLASATATIGLTGSLIGAGLGPLAVGALSDALQPRFGNESLVYISLALCPGFLWAAWHAWRASKSVTGDLAAMQEGRDESERDASTVRISPEIN